MHYDLVCHLARPFDKIKGIETVALEGDIYRRVRQVDSQLVSWRFGGKRTVEADDLRAFYIGPGVLPEFSQSPIDKV